MARGRAKQSKVTPKAWLLAPISVYDHDRAWGRGIFANCTCQWSSFRPQGGSLGRLEWGPGVALGLCCGGCLKAGSGVEAVDGHPGLEAVISSADVLSRTSPTREDNRAGGLPRHTLRRGQSGVLQQPRKTHRSRRAGGEMGEDGKTMRLRTGTPAGEG